MGRRAKPWFLESDGWWYVWHAGKQEKLAYGKGAKDEAEKEFHRLKAEAGTPIVTSRMTVAHAFDLFLEHSQQHHATDTYRWYRDVLSKAARGFGSVRLSALRVHHVSRWLDSREIGDTTKHQHIGVIQAALNFCVKQQYIPLNPVKGMDRPVKSNRNRVLSPDERDVIFTAIKDGPFTDFLTALQETGCRPGEVMKVTPENVNLEAGTWVLPEHKNKKRRKGEARTIYLTPRMIELTRVRLADTEPGQPLFRNARGRPWTRQTLYRRWEELKQKHPELEGVVTYTWRHTYITDGLERGLSESVLSELCGNSPETIHKHYAHLESKKAFLKEMAKKAVGG